MIYLIPAIAAGLYALGSMGLKRSMQAGAPPRRVMSVSNLAMALWSLPLIFLPAQWDCQAWLMAVGAGFSLFLGRIFSIKALEAGDLSIVAPLLGMKTVLVAVFSMVFFPFQMTSSLLLSAVLASCGVALLQRGPIERRRGTRRAAAYAAGASLLFAITDITVQGSAQVLGPGYLVPTLFISVACLTPLLGHHSPPPENSVRDLYAGSVTIGFQTMLMILTISLLGQATLVNVIYSTRSLWAVWVDRCMGDEHIRAYLWSRLCGALLVTSSVILAIFSR